jgi:hypothetical protein
MRGRGRKNKARRRTGGCISIRSGKAKRRLNKYRKNTTGTTGTAGGCEDVLSYSTKTKAFPDTGNSDLERRKRCFQITTR